MDTLSINGPEVSAEHGTTVLEGGKRDMSEVLVDLAAVADADDENNEDIVIDMTNDAIIADPDAVHMCISCQLFASWRPWLFCRPSNRLVESPGNCGWQPFHGAPGRRLDVYPVGHSKIQFLAEFFVRDAVGGFRKHLFHFFAVDLVLQFFYVLFEQSQVAHGNKRGDRLAVALEENRLTVLDTPDGIGQVIVHRLKDLLRHGISPHVEPDNRIIARRAPRWQPACSHVIGDTAVAH